MMATSQHIPYADLTAEERHQLRTMRKRKAELMNEIEAMNNELRSVEGQLENIYYVDDPSKETAQQRATGRRKFNQDPEAGLTYLYDRNLLERTPESVAAFLHNGAGLSKQTIGEYIGSNEPFNVQVLEAYVKLHDISNMFLVDALRIFLWSFRLPGESQKIERMMAKFAEHFHSSSTLDGHAFDCPDTAHVLSYSCIMLNTLLHNPAVKDKPTLERFLSMNKESIQNNGVSVQTIENIYDSIAKQPFKLPDEESMRTHEPFIDSQREGWLYKQSSSQAFVVGPLMWKRRWFVLSEGCLYYFDSSVDRTPKGIIPLKNVGVRRVEAPARPHMLEIYALSPEDKIKACKTDQVGGRVTEGRHSNYRMCAASQDDLIGWIEAIHVQCQNQRV
ncbi:hypothetical protein PFISCL1PPCAC_9586 [Pristionchus fissidentatus]|uniref:Uncharacterized protein n=1 Tax=Pristionchus fissidentatus TaxID=1538716 RepID=A0AAV5VFU9_9BILA|nr:hypothetical protein PFISCL1PPCAC_9586 [Pristionchus fissidentatus]